jgi:hypothetical protein
MKYFIDCEFLEYEKQPKFLGLFNAGKPIPTTELISIAFVREDGKEYYAETTFNMKAAKQHDFLPENVLPHLKGGDTVKPRKQIATEIINFIGNDTNPQLVGWWSAYDWYVLCRELFGTMGECMHATKMWYFTDLKQYLYDVHNIEKRHVTSRFPLKGTAHNALDDARWLKEVYFGMKNLLHMNLQTGLQEQAHASLAGLIKHVFNRIEANKDGSYTIPADKAKKWLSRADKKSYMDLTPQEQNTPRNEAIKYELVLTNDYNRFLQPNGFTIA